MRSLEDKLSHAEEACIKYENEINELKGKLSRKQDASEALCKSHEHLEQENIRLNRENVSLRVALKKVTDIL